ncbi:MAG: hypothetical protein A2W29_03145 [Gemmatimonadetes bacterium RBG_16_66_8]|nr:MAG: hypothetical protein A2W29_03145 [Gemmatimonadetes bacterium RBG_16_66_8]
MNRLSRHAVLVVLASFAVASAAVAQRKALAPQQSSRPLLGPQLGFATESLDFFVGAQFAYPVAKSFDLYPSFQIFFPGNNITVWSLNAEGRYWVKLNTPNPGLYVGGGLNYTHTSVSVVGFSASASDVGLGLLGGWDFKAVSWRPFAQIHFVLGDANRVEFGGGVNFKL